MTPDKIEFHIGETLYGQPLRLVRSRDSSGSITWILYRDAADQRDDHTFISGLTRDALLKFAEAAKYSS